MRRRGSLPIFVSYTYPHRPEQEEFLAAAAEVMADHGMQPVLLSRPHWSFESPLVPIQKLMRSCVGTLVIATIRSRIAEGIDYVGGASPRAYEDRNLATEWTHIEAAMAFQVGHPILVLRERGLHASGLLDGRRSGLTVKTIALGGDPADNVEVLVRQLPDFRERAEAYAATRALSD